MLLYLYQLPLNTYYCSLHYWPQLLTVLDKEYIQYYLIYLEIGLGAGIQPSRRLYLCLQKEDMKGGWEESRRKILKKD